MNKEGRIGVAALAVALLLLSFALPILACCPNDGDINGFVRPTESEESVAAVRIDSALPDTGSDEVSLGSRLWELFAGTSVEAPTTNQRPSLIVGGCIFGTRIKEAHVTVSAAEEDCPLREGDKIISINGKEIHSIAEIKEILRGSDGNALSLVCKRGGKRISLKCTPKRSESEYRLGITLREGAAGIGTVTYIDPATGEFGGLGHGICDPDDGKIIEMTGGSVTDVILGGVVKGESGKPGELSGILTDRPMGEIYSNTECGVFGKLTATPRGAGSNILPIAYRHEVKAGEAKIISTLKNGKTLEYKVELSDIKVNATGSKCFRIKITDPALISVSGGIVRGMSGSPIIQDGKLVGAVTHVLINDPTEGYGIFIENMLNAAENTVPKAA